MALSNLPALSGDSEIERLLAERDRLLAEQAELRGLSLDYSVIRLRIGDVTYGIPLHDIGVLLDAKLPDLLNSKRSMTSKEQALRSGIKALLPMMLRLIGGEVEKASRQLVEQGAGPLPLPDLKVRHADLMDYATRYVTALILSLLAINPWEAQLGETVDGPDGYVRLADLSGGIIPPSDGTPPPDASGGPADAA